MNEDGQDGAAFHAEQLQTQRDIEDALRAAMRGPINEEQASLLAWASGITTKEYRNEMV